MGALGSAIIAAVGVGIYEDVRTAIFSMVHVDRRYEPDPSRRVDTDRRYAQYVRVTDLLAGAWRGGTLGQPPVVQVPVDGRNAMTASRFLLAADVDAARHVQATYMIRGAREDQILTTAERFAVGQTVGTWVDVPHADAELFNRYGGKVVSIFAAPHRTFPNARTRPSCTSSP